jgi:hypothetical protein
MLLAWQRLRAVFGHQEFIAVPSPHSLDERVDRGQQLGRWRGQVEGVAVDGDVGADDSDCMGGGVAFRVDRVAVELPTDAAELAVGEVDVKDEPNRFGLPAFMGTGRVMGDVPRTQWLVEGRPDNNDGHHPV